MQDSPNDEIKQTKGDSNGNLIKNDDKQPLYLIENIDKFTTSHFLREKKNIQHSRDFPNAEYEGYLKKIFGTFYEDDQDKEKWYNDYNFFIEWLTISCTTININHAYLTSKIQLTGKSQLNSEYTIYIAQDLSKTESAVEVFANSTAIFENCYFKNSERIAVLVRDFSTVKFNNCTFENNNISVFLSNESYAKFTNCKFKNDKYISIFNTKNSHTEIINCLFYDLNGKAIFAKDESVILVKDTIFDKCKKGAATIAEKSKLILDGGVEIKDSSNTALRSIKNSTIKAHDIKIKNTDGNGLNIDDSTGYFVNCHFDNTIHPTIAVLGKKSNPIFHNCTLDNNNGTFCVLCKNGCRPLFDGCTFNDCQTNCFSISDFSKPHVQNCEFNRIEKYIMNVFGGSSLTYNKLTTNDDDANKVVEIDYAKKICIRKSAKGEEITLEKLNNEEKEKKKKQKDDGDEDDDEDDDDGDGFHCRSWMSPSYKKPERIKDINDPSVLSEKGLIYLIVLKSKEIMENAMSQKTSFKCCNCNHELTKDDGPCILSPCGHLVCNTCKDLYTNEKKRCPICDTPISKVQRIFFEDTCALCLCNKPNTISLPCGHLCMCYECALQNAANGYNCPMCNEPMTNFKFTFDDNCDDVKKNKKDEDQKNSAENECDNDDDKDEVQKNSAENECDDDDNKMINKSASSVYLLKANKITNDLVKADGIAYSKSQSFNYKSKANL